MKLRLTRSLIFGFVFICLLVFGFFKAPDYFESVHEINGKIWQQYGVHRESLPLPAPGPGKKPRVNGGIGLTSTVDIANYSVNVESGETNLKLRLPDLESKPRTSVSTLFKCIEGWSEPVQYSGIKFSDFMEAYNVGKKSDGTYYKYVGLETPDEEYYVSIDMQSMLHPQSVLAFEMNGAALTSDNGFPIRLIIPIKYGIKSLKRIGRIFFSDERPRDYWNEEGYDWFAGL